MIAHKRLFYRPCHASLFFPKLLLWLLMTEVMKYSAISNVIYSTHKQSIFG